MPAVQRLPAPRRFVLAFALLAIGSGCAASYPAPTSTLSATVMTLRHVERDPHPRRPDALALCALSREELARADRHVRSGNHREAEQWALRAFKHAREAAALQHKQASNQALAYAPAGAVASTSGSEYEGAGSSSRTRFPTVVRSVR